MSRKNNPVVNLALGLVFAATAAGLALWKLRAGSLVTGMVWGGGIAYFGVLVYTLLLPKKSGGRGLVPAGYLLGAVVRYAVMIGVFCIAVFMVKINGIGLLIGLFIVMTASTFFFLNKMRQGPTPPVED